MGKTNLNEDDDGSENGDGSENDELQLELLRTTSLSLVEEGRLLVRDGEAAAISWWWRSYCDLTVVAKLLRSPMDWC